MSQIELENTDADTPAYTTPFSMKLIAPVKAAGNVQI